MSTIEFLSQLRKLGIELRAEGEQLRLNAPKGAVTPQLREELQARKNEILDFLRTADTRNQAIAAIHPYPREGSLPLSFSQERLWFLDQLNPGNYAYNMPGATRLKGTLHVACLEQALNEIIARHESLRTNFEMVGEEPVQVIFPPKPLPVTFIDLRHLPAEEQLIEARRITEEEARHPFNLHKDLLVRATLIKLAEEDHVLLVTMHHIASDGWSRRVLMREFATLYEAFIADRPSPLPPLPIQYADFAQWQREWLQGERLEAQLAYWKKQLSGDIPQLQALLEKPRPAVASSHSGRENLTLSVPLVQSLRRLSQTEDASLFMVLLAAFKLLLYRFTGVEDITVGSPIAGRNRAELENLIGVFLNTLVFRTDLSGDPSFRELLRRVQEITTDAYTHQDIPFEQLLIELHPERSLNRTPFFQVFFNMLNLNEITGTLSGLTVEEFERADIGSKFDFTLYLTEDNNAINLVLVYNTDLFLPERIKELLSQYQILLTQIADQPEQKITNFSLVTPYAREILPNPVLELDEPKQVLLPQMIREWVAKTPDQIALVQREQQWTYAQLYEQAEKLAHLVVSKGLNPGDVVAVCGSRSFALIASMVAAFLSGGVLLSIDPALPDQRKQLMLREASAKALIVIGEQPSNWADMIAPDNIIRLHHGIEVETTSVALPKLSGEDAAYVFFTSGTTGVPKGVKGNHKGLAHFLSWQRDTFCIQPHDRAAQLTALSFDVLLRDIFLALVSGATLCLPEDNLQLDADATLTWLRESRISIVHTVPTLAQTWLSSPAVTPLPDLHRVFFAGEPLKESLVLAWRKHFPQCSIVNLYGPTETTMAKCFYVVPEQLLPGIQPVGSPLPQTQALILNKSGQLCGIGEPGEIVIRTPFRTFGYINAPEEQTRKFVPNPFTHDPRDLVYYSGDQGRYRPDGQLDILGRIDGQVKIRGNRIELSEIEAALIQHASVQHAVAAVWEPEPGDKRLAAYMVVKPEQEFQPNALRSFLKERLPEAMIPSSFTQIEIVPLTPNGKVNRKALPIPEQTERDLQHEQVHARNATEEKLVQIWEDLLRVRPIGVTDNFFELGGHSLLAVHLFTRINQQFGINLPLATLFKEATIEQLGAAIQQQAKPTTWSSLIAIEPQGSHPPFFCIHGITGDVLWFRDLARALAPDYPFYGLQARGLDGIQEPFSQIEPMATYYIEEIRRLQPKGPYFLGGASFGGAIAYEIAQQFLQQGEQVALLAIFDQSPPNTELPSDKSFKGKLVKGIKLAKNFPGWFPEFLKLGPSRMLLRIRRKAKQAGKLREFAKTENAELFDATDLVDFAGELDSYRQQLIMSHYQAKRAYRTQPYRGRVTLFRAKARPLMSTHDPEAAWKRIDLGHLDVIHVPGSHEGMFKLPNVNYLAGQLTKLIDQATANNQH